MYPSQSSMVPKGLKKVAIVLTVAFILLYTVSGADEENSHETTNSHTDEDYSTHDDHSSHSSVDPNVFVLGSYFDYDVFVVLLCAVGGSAMILEFILKIYENWMKREGDQFQSTLYDKIVRELMTLGVVSFVLFLLQPVLNTGTLFVIFEFAHYVIFFVAIFAVLQLVLLGASTYPVKRTWDVAAFKSKDELIAGYRRMISHLRKWSVPVPLLGRVSLDVFHWSHHWRWTDRVQYHLARSVFIRQHGRSADFDFARYAVKVTNRQILSMANFSLSNWLVLILLHWLFCGLGQIAPPKQKDEIGFVAWFVIGMILCGLEMALLYACMIGLKKISVKLGADPSDPFGTLDVVLDKIWVVPVTHIQHRRLSDDNSVKDSLSGLGVVREEKTTEDTKQAEAPMFGGILKNDDDVVGNGVEVSKIATIPRIVMKDAFVLPSRSMYGTAVELLMLLNSYYLAVYAVYFISPASKSSTAWFWIILLPLPIAGGVLMAYRRVIPLIALLSTIVVLHSSDVADVEQETEDLNKLRRKLVMRVEDVLEKEYQKTVADSEGKALGGLTPAGFLLKRWDTDGNGTLSYNELQKGLGAIGLVLSSRQRKELLRLADPDRNGCIDIEELTDLLYDVSVEVAAAVAAEASEAGKPPNASTTLKRLLSHSVGGGMENSRVNERVERMLLRRTYSSKLP